MAEEAAAKPAVVSTYTRLLDRPDLVVRYDTKCTTDDGAFSELFSQVEIAVEHGRYPELIPSGSSGSYISTNMDGVSTTACTCIVL